MSPQLKIKSKATPLIFIKYQQEAYSRIYDEIRQNIMKKREEGIACLKVTAYPPRILFKIMDELMAEGYAISYMKPKNAEYIEMWITWGNENYYGE